MDATLQGVGDIAARLGFAVAIGVVIGLNRWLRHKPAGVRTHALVTLGAALATVLISRDANGDAQAVSRVIQGLVTGVGFIGAGVILHVGAEHRVQGLTTAAALWASAILGIVCGVSELIPPELLTLPALGFIGMHPTFLPQGRGRAHHAQAAGRASLSG